MLRRSFPRIILLATLVVAGYLLFNTVLTTLNSYRLATDEQQVRREIAELEADRQKLLAIREYLSSDEYIESVARRTLGLVKPGETLVKVQSPENETASGEAVDHDAYGESWWESLFEP